MLPALYPPPGTLPTCTSTQLVADRGCGGTVRIVVQRIRSTRGLKPDHVVFHRAEFLYSSGVQSCWPSVNRVLIRRGAACWRSSKKVAALCGAARSRGCQDVINDASIG